MSKKPKAPSRKRIVRDLDALFSEVIRKRDGDTCFVCGSRERPQCGHIFSRVSYRTRWDLANAVVLCSGCNLRHEFDPYPLLRRCIDYYGIGGLDALYARTKGASRIKTSELVARRDSLLIVRDHLPST